MTINLEKSLIKENKKLVTPAELLLIKEYDKHTALVENDALSRLGLNNNLHLGKRIKSKIDEKRAGTAKFSQDRVFHISQIESLCKRYHLRCLNVGYYKGTIDEELPNKITNFEIAYGVKCSVYNTYIAAPASSFKLQQRPKDPLMFYQINSEYYYLIHKWGNDLSIFRAMLPYLSTALFTWLIVPLVLMPILWFFFPAYFLWITGGIAFIWGVIMGVSEDELRFVEENSWNSSYTG